MIAEFLEWLSYINLYPYYDAWNICGMVVVLFWIFWTFLHLRSRLGIIRGGILGFFFSFMWISMIDEVMIFLSVPILLKVGYQPINFLSRWFWKFFFLYWCLKFIYVYIGDELVITPTTIYAIGIYWTWYFVYYYQMFFPYNFKGWYMTQYPRWFIYGTGYLYGWIFSSVIYLSVWRFKAPEPYIEKYGIGEGYMMYALKGLLNKLKKRHRIVGNVDEYRTFEASETFPDREWSINSYSGDLVFAYRATPEVVKELVSGLYKCPMFLLMASNPVPIARLSQKVFGSEEIYWATTGELEALAKDNGLKVIESGHFDCPPWFDHSSGKIAPTKRLGLDLSLCRQLQFFEWFNNRFWSHHSYVLAEVSI